MKLWGHKTPPVPRRRPAQDEMPGRRREAFSYYAKRSGSAANTGRLDAAAIEAANGAQAGHGKPQRWLVVVIVVLVIGLLAGMTNLSGRPHVTTAAAANNRYFLKSDAEYQQTVADELRSSILNQNKLTVDTAGLRQDIIRKYPEIKTVDIQIPFIGNSPKVVLTPYKASYVFVSTNSSSYLLDETGRAVIAADELADAGTLSVPRLQDKSGRSVNPGSQALPGTTIAFIDYVVSALKSQNVAFSSLVLPSAASELDVYISGQPYFVKFNLQGDARLQAGTFLATRAQLARNHIVPAQYLDVRVPERAYYK